MRVHQEHTETLTAQAGCDSVAVMELTIIPTLANTSIQLVFAQETARC